MLEVVLAAGIVVCVILIAVLVARGPRSVGYTEDQLQARLEALSEQKDAEASRANAALQQSFAQIQAQQQQNFVQVQKQQQDTLNATIEMLRSDFTRLASESLEAKAKTLSEKNAADVKPLFDGIRERFAELQKASSEAKEANVRLGESLKAKLDEVGLKAQSLGQQADEFVAALKGGNKVQGNWGEGILVKVLEDAGLKEGVNFVQQTGGQGAGLPDVTVFDGATRKILIDSKVNITDFITAVNAEKEGRIEEAAVSFKAHITSIRHQIDNLASKCYPEKFGEKDPASDYSEIVIMMMPSEATYVAAVTKDPTLPVYANARRIVLATPQMLFGYLVLFKAGLDRLQAEKHQQEIVKQAGYIIDRMDAAFAALEGLGKSLADAQAKFAEAKGKLGDGSNPQNILTPAREILRLSGSRTKAPKSVAMQG